MMGAAVPNLFLKWLAFRKLLDPPQSNAEIATRIWGPDDGPPKFSKLLRGDYGCEPDVVGFLAEVVNKRLAIVRGAKGRGGPPAYTFRGSDFELPLFDFARRLIEVAEVIDQDTLDRAHSALFEEFSPTPSRGSHGPQLAIEQFATTKFFEGTEAASDGPPIFEIGRHKGLFAIEGVAPEMLERRMCTYAMFARDPTPAGSRIWDVPFKDAIRWIPSPFTPTVRDGRVILMPEARPVQPVVGRFHITVVLVFDASVVGRLDPAGTEPPSRALEEIETARFLTNLGRVTRSNANAIALCAGEYIVREPKRK